LTGADTNLDDLRKLCICCHDQFPSTLATCPNDGTTLTEIKRDDFVGTVFAEKYEMLDIIGGGGMGMVYRAKHQLMNRIVAIKILHKANVTSNDAIKRFQVEAQAASALSMPNIISVFDFGVAPSGQPYMVMDYLDGKSISDVLGSDGRFPLERALNIFIQICDALAHAHAKSIIHRDIKPSNIVLIDIEGQSDFVKIVDFGIAKLLNADPDSGNLTRTGEVFGSPAYMSPEQWKGHKLDARADIYSLGAVMYRCLSGKSMFEADDILQLMYKQVTEMPSSFASLGVSLPTEIEQIVFKAIEKDPANRYQSMRELMAVLSQFKQGTSTFDALAPVPMAGDSDRREVSNSPPVSVRVSATGEKSNTTVVSVSDNEGHKDLPPPYVVNKTDAVTSEITAAQTPAFEPKNSVSQQQKMSSLVRSPEIIAVFVAVILSIGVAIVLIITGTSFHKGPVPEPEKLESTSQSKQSEPTIINQPVRSEKSEAKSIDETIIREKALQTRPRIVSAPVTSARVAHPRKSHSHPIGGIKNALRHFLRKL
jgi:serine/threonine protein kinase